jgi:CRP/FNR family cyclic AMP-dependent transcriptional regulator
MNQPLPPERTFKNGETVIEKGEPAFEAFLIVEGRAEVSLSGQKLANLSEGDIFGEAALFKGSDYGADVKAAGLLKVQPITPSILDEKIARCDPMLRALIRMMMIRLRRTNEALSKSANNL